MSDVQYSMMKEIQLRHSSFKIRYSMFKKALHPLLHLFIPHQCAGCGSDNMSRQQVLCMHCINRLPATAAASYLYFSKDSVLQHIVHELKYRGNKELGMFIGRKMGEALLHAQRFKDVDALIPLPLFAARERKRGYNQATLLCNGMAEILKLPVLTRVICRHTPSETQTNKNRIDRWLNMQGKFVLQQPDAINGKHILLVDDVITTGATLEACGQELLTAPGTRLSIMTMAYTVK
jgi:ComF family protein